MHSDATVLKNGDVLGAYAPFMVGDEPTGHFAELTGANSAVRAGVYKVNPGEYPDGVPVPYEFDRDEYLYVLEGEVEIDFGESSVIRLKPGDGASFRKGSTSIWTFHAPFRKFSVEVG
ncbi:hypothetical protein DSM104329_02444 [Capillimicrobium parvum]|uniref:(S)-ureidoglycine aminohydrolase cupin domain-containing protein n=1 Tax=Capillimicrobium parvum TaxID=2884022 RepID=A0A9E6XX12_9ACTN|nr:hypothetical protein DSM104329_02444 [Capillimicrobium parvum]